MIQGSQEWHDYRRTRIGASDFALMCSSLGYSANLFNTSVELSINDKLNNKVMEDNYFTSKGKELEPILLNYLKTLDINGTQDIITYCDNDSIMASLDCYDKKNNILIEIKTTSKSLDKYDELIKYYQYQVVHQYYTLNTNSISYILIYNLVSEDLQLIKIDCNEIMNKDTWLDICNKYLEKIDEIQNNKNNYNIIQLLDAREKIELQIKELSKQSKEISDYIKELYKESTVVGDYKITVSTNKTAKYSNYIKDNNINLDDKYYTESTNVTIKKLKGE
jgi:predicted phage-related endonuclease